MATNAKLSLITEAELGTKGLVVTVTKGKEEDKKDIFGHLMIGKASLVWFEKNAKSKGRKVSWDEFHEWIMQRREEKATRP